MEPTTNQFGFLQRDTCKIGKGNVKLLLKDKRSSRVFAIRAADVIDVSHCGSLCRQEDDEIVKGLRCDAAKRLARIGRIEKTDTDRMPFAEKTERLLIIERQLVHVRHAPSAPADPLKRSTDPRQAFVRKQIDEKQARRFGLTPVGREEIENLMPRPQTWPVD